MRPEAMEIAFAGAVLDRADALRSDPEAMRGARADDRARVLVLSRLAPPVEDGRLAWREIADEDGELVFLGLDHGAPRFALNETSGEGELPRPELFARIAQVPPADAGAYATARSLLDWHARHQHCAKCGAPTVLTKGGWQRNCTASTCGAEHFPRTDPVTIMLVECEGQLLLGRQPRFPAGSFSALAGFIEPGETIEGAVAREVLEEAGVAVRDVTYVASQPWPFPSSLMIGCHAHADDRTLTIDYTELEDARWFTRADVAAALAGDAAAPFVAPSSYAIARRLLEWWMAR